MDGELFAMSVLFMIATFVPIIIGLVLLIVDKFNKKE